MRTYPLESIDIQYARKLQFKLIDVITRHFKGKDILSCGDLGVVPGLNQPVTTKKVCEVLADFFEAEACTLVRGAGTGALRYGIGSIFKPGNTILVHEAPIYPTTKVSIESMGLNVIYADFNHLNEIKNSLLNNKIQGVLVQYTRQKIDDKYNIGEVIGEIKKIQGDMPVITDDNYAVMKVRNIGAQYGADLSAFSTFKLLGPEGVGCVVGKRKYIQKIREVNYSGGSQVQGHEAMEALRGMIYAPVELAIQAEVNEELVKRLNQGEIPEIKGVFLANAQSKVLLVEFYKNIAKEVLQLTEELGAAPNPVGSESKYEFVPMIYRISGTFRKADPSLEERMIRINPMRSGADTIIRILKEALKKIG